MLIPNPLGARFKLQIQVRLIREVNPEILLSPWIRVIDWLIGLRTVFVFASEAPTDIVLACFVWFVAQLSEVFVS